MTRRGKIARIPHSIREQINRRLQNGDGAAKIADWLNSLPKVKAIIAAEFDGQPINENNLSNWKLGGFLDWQEQQDSLEAVCRFGEDALELSQTAAAPLADQLALCLTARLAVALRQRPDDARDPAAQLQRLRQLCADLARLRRGDHNAQWLRLEQKRTEGWLRLQRKKLDLSLRKYNDIVAERKKAKKAAKPAGDGSVPKEVFDRFAEELKLI
ncbi:MAG: hypothetical protein ABSA47_12370 [Verrucomicrobiota bacterium]|jgi:hypothetical protein